MWALQGSAGAGFSTVASRGGRSAVSSARHFCPATPLAPLSSEAPSASCRGPVMPVLSLRGRLQRGLQRPAFNTAGDRSVESTLQEQLMPSLWFADQAPTPDQLPDILPALSPKQLADAIWSFAKQGLSPTAEVMDAVAAEVLTKLSLFRSQDLSNTIWALAVLKYQPSSEWWEAFERQVFQHVTEFTDREMGNLLWSLAVLEHRPTWVLEPLSAAAMDAFPVFSANALHLVGWACGKLGFSPGDEWLDSYLKACQSNFFHFSPSEMSNIIWALAVLGYKLPAMWLDTFLMVAQWRFPNFSAKTLSVIAWAVASLGHTPTQEWLVSFEQQVREKFHAFSGQELACIAWALRRFGYAPEHNAVFYMLERQENFVAADFEILGNSKLLGQVINWRKGESSQASASGLDLSSGGSNSAPPRAADDAGNGSGSNHNNN